MPRFFFHTEDGQCLADRDGTELADLEEAKRESVRLLGCTLNETPHIFWNEENFRVIVADDQGLSLFNLHVGVNWAPVMSRQKRKP